MSKKILLVEPGFPIPKKSKNHKDFLPVGLLKLGKMHKDKGNRVKLIRGKRSKTEIAKRGEDKWFVPHKILVTSLFTYWKPDVVDCVNYYEDLYDESYLDPVIKVGGIYASLMPQDCKKIEGVDEVYEGVHHEAEKYKPDYNLIEQNPKPVNFQIIHASRGCPRECEFCGVWRIEPEFKEKETIKDKLVDGKNGVVFYDNNLLKNNNIENILDELIELKEKGEIKWCESQSGFDGRILQDKPNLAKKIYEAGFRYPRIAWDWGYDEKDKIGDQLDILNEAGYNYKEIFVFVLYNWEIPFKEMERKRIKCFDWGVQIADCRYRPLDQTFDNYNPRKYKYGQTEEDYYIYKKGGWTDAKIRQFRKNVRRQNICVRQKLNFYSKDLERKRLSKKKIKNIMNKIEKLPNREKKIEYLEKEDVHYWFPDEVTFPGKENKNIENFE